jgi:hypothetical protein
MFLLLVWATLTPFAPLVLTMIPLEGLLERILKTTFHPSRSHETIVPLIPAGFWYRIQPMEKWRRGHSKHFRNLSHTLIAS